MKVEKHEMNEVDKHRMDEVEVVGTRRLGLEFCEIGFCIQVLVFL